MHQGGGIYLSKEDRKGRGNSHFNMYKLREELVSRVHSGFIICLYDIFKINIK